MGNARDIKSRLKSIKSTQKTTHAMELVSGAKMRKAVESAVKTREYRAVSWAIMKRLRAGVTLPETDPLSRFFAEPSGHRTLVVAFTSNRGLCGGFNSQIVKLITQHARENEDEEIQIIGVGKRGVGSLTSLDMNVVQAYPKDDLAKDDSSVREIASIIHKQFSDSEVDRVLIAYTDYQSPIAQTPRLEQLFPFPTETALGVDEEEAQTNGASYTHEPSEEEVLSTVIPRAAEVLLYQALLESNASEHSSRMVAMKNATEAAGEMAEELQLEFNRARQAAITNEIAEIAAGAAAVR